MELALTQEISLTPDIISTKLQSLMEELGCNFAFIFGSFVKNKTRWWSDLDLVISLPSFKESSPKEQYRLLGEISLKIEELLKVNNLELHIWEIIPIRLKFQILKDNVCIFDPIPIETQRVKERILIEYWDHKIWYDRMMADMV